MARFTIRMSTVFVAFGLAFALVGIGQAAADLNLRTLKGPAGKALKTAVIDEGSFPRGIPNWCMTAYRARSDSRWGVVTYSGKAARFPEVCQLSDSGGLLFFKRGKNRSSWRLAGSSWWGVGCRFEKQPPKRVWRDFGCGDLPRAHPLDVLGRETSNV